MIQLLFVDGNEVIK